MALLVILGAAAGGAFIFAQFFGGGPTLAAWWGVAKGGAMKVMEGMVGGTAKGTNGTIGTSERTPLTGAAPKVSASAAAERLNFAAR